VSKPSLPHDNLSVYDFGQALLDANDLDPVYALVVHTPMDLAQLERWLLAYWGFYHIGTACWIAERQEGYWDRFFAAAGSKDYPRSSERRHFRGDNALKSVTYLRGVGLESLFGYFDQSSFRPYPLQASQVMGYVQSWVGFGPWIAFKVADMLERIGYCDITFSLDDVMYDSPAKAAMTLWEMEGQPHAGFNNQGSWAVQRILSNLLLPDGTLPYAPPRGFRPVGFQEAETILCKWKSYLGGHYEVGEDVLHCRAALARFARSNLSQRMYGGGKRAKLW